MLVKRTLDITTSALLLLLALPSLLIAAWIIRLTSKGPILFRQMRMGRNFQPFEILKLRTMEFAAPGLAYTMGADPRITPFGKFLRRSKLDEVPQLWNVLRGDMSLVGPRPVLPELTEEFRAHYARLLTVRPGLTDPASLKYSQEARLLGSVPDPMRFFKTVVTPDKIAISLRYVERSNLWTDGVTLAMTALICCFPSLGSVSQSLLDSGEGGGFVWNPDAEFRLRMDRLRARQRGGAPHRLLMFPNNQSKQSRAGLAWNPVSARQRAEISTSRRTRQRVSLL
jgi:lipopolysaccharide/colanic/teichoic acid biosynthesis glycosyltransferase